MNNAENDEREVITLEKNFADALTRGDRALLDRLMADDFIGINPLCQVLEKLQVIEEITSPHYEVESLVNDDIRVRIYAEVAVATGRGTVKGKYKGEDTTGQFRYTRVWVRQQGSWRAVAAQATMTPL
jgi:ketosteroid isomerase-like protein